jgi:hypothetical protein
MATEELNCLARCSPSQLKEEELRARKRTSRVKKTDCGQLK